jgi:putative methylase
MTPSSKANLAVILSQLSTFTNPKPEAEQYQTESENAAAICWSAYMNGDIKGKIVADLGAGNGIFGIACILLQAKQVHFVDKDPECITLIKENLDLLKLTPTQEKRVLLHNIDISLFKEKVDTVLENPPFGVQKAHADLPFLETAFKTADIIYSIHMADSREWVENKAKQHSFKLTHCAEFSFLLKKSMSHHTKDKVTTQVICVRMVRL